MKQRRPNFAKILEPGAKYRHFARVHPRHTKADHFCIEKLVYEKQRSREASHESREASPVQLSLGDSASLQHFHTFQLAQSGEQENSSPSKILDNSLDEIQEEKQIYISESNNVTQELSTQPII